MNQYYTCIINLSYDYIAKQKLFKKLQHDKLS